jgi:hypothetical protein
MPYIFTDLRHLITWYACLPDYFSRKNIKTVVKSSVCRITNFGNVDKALFVYFISLYNFSSEIKIIKSEINVKLNPYATLK